MRIVAVLALVILALSVAWFAGEKHRENCEHAGKVSCSVLPWDTGRRLDPCDSKSRILRESGYYDEFCRP